MAAGIDDILNDLIVRVGRVRRWLLALSVLRVMAVGLAGVSLYIGLYAWLDHHVHFGTPGRMSAFVLFVGMIAVGLYHVIRVLRRDMTYAHAANHIEGRRSFDQQLVAAVEYYEGGGDYPYSRALAEQLVCQVDAAAREYRFDSTIAKWQGYLLLGFVLLCAGVIGFFVHENVLYISSYLARLVRPFSTIAPVPAMALESATRDVVAGVDAPVTLTAEVEGRVPESVTLMLTRRDPNDVNESPSENAERVELTPAVDADGKTRFTTTRSFDTAGRFEYRFETPDVSSDSHIIRICEPPSVKSIMAKVFPPAAAQRSGLPDAREISATRELPPVEPYEQEWTDQPLAVLPGSRVELTAKATTSLREAVVIGPDGRASTQSLNGADSFGFEFTADTPSSVKLSAVSSDGLASGEAKELRVVLKSDEPPQFKLIRPEGDYLATDVASIPISFEVTDDFGVASAQLVCELPGHGPVVLESASPRGARQYLLTHTLELEQYDLHVGDGILFYATARDVATGHRPGDPNASSEVYFIEIRPYRQFWHPEPGGGRPSSNSGPIAEDLLAVLEYTRAVVKKAWTLARSPGTAGEDRPKLESLSADVRYCALRLTKIRDDPEAGLGDGDKAVVNEVLKSYEQARQQLDRHDADAALPPAQEAYRILRMLIDELHLKWTPPQSGPSSPQETPERVKLQEQPQEPKMEKERIESRLQEMRQNIDSLTRQQESLKADLAKAQRQEKEADAKGKSADKTGSGQGSGEDSEGRPGDERQASSQGNQAGGQEDGVARSNLFDRGSVGQTSPGEGARRNESGGGARAGEQAGQSAEGPGGASARRDAQMRILQAKQKVLREQVSQLSEEMDGLPASESSAHGRAKQQAKGHLDQAADAMRQFEEKLADARYGASNSSEAGDMADPADSAARRLAEAGQAIRRGLSREGQDSADKAQEMAEQLAKDAQAYDESLSEAEKQKMLDRLAAARRLLETMTGARWATISDGGGPGAGLVYTNDPHTSAADAARLLARQFWSVALEAKKRRSRPVEEEPSDVTFFEAENEFFETAAQFGPGQVEK